MSTSLGQRAIDDIAILKSAVAMTEC